MRQAGLQTPPAIFLMMNQAGLQTPPAISNSFRFSNTIYLLALSIGLPYLFRRI